MGSRKNFRLPINLHIYKPEFAELHSASFAANCRSQLMREDSYEDSQLALTRYSKQDRLRQQARFDKPSRRTPAIVLTPLATF